MKKGFKRFLSGALATVMAVAGMTVGMATSAMAATNTYNMNSAGVTAYAYDGNNPSNVLASNAVLSMTGSNTITVLKDLKPALISYDGNSKGYFSEAVSEGTLAGTVLDYAMITTSGSTKDFMTISDINAGDIVEVYYAGVDSKGATGKATSIIIKEDANTAQTYNVNVGEGNKSPVYALYSCTIDGTVTISTTGTRVGIAAIVVTTSDGVSVYWPNGDVETEEVSQWVGGEPTNYLSGITTSNGAVNVGGKESKTKIRLGKDACTDINVPTIANSGYITFPGIDGGFTVLVSAASSGDSERVFYVGIVNDDGTFTDKATLSVTGNVATSVSAKITDSSASETYAVYVKPKENGSVADNTDIFSIDTAPADAVYVTTPTVTLEGAVIDTDGKLTVTGVFNKFSGSYYEVDSITLRAATGKDTQEAAVWTLNDITILKDNGNGTASFIAKVDNPREDARFQALATYNGISDVTADVENVTIYSNLAIYNAAE